MQMQVNGEKIRKWRDERCWSQEQLADIAEVSYRTIQRIEAGGGASNETIMSLATAFNVDASALLLDVNGEAKKALRKQELRKNAEFGLSFWIHFATYLFVASLLITINYVDAREDPWALWPLVGWGIGVAAHGLAAFIVKATSSAEREIDALDGDMS
ncbi:MAG: helix-turn-helix domain-containing protein [Pseudomonadota bacterium]